MTRNERQQQQLDTAGSVVTPLLETRTSRTQDKKHPGIGKHHPYGERYSKLLWRYSCKYRPTSNSFQFQNRLADLLFPQ
eukprot:6458149-Amphidinium_carterae.1